MPLLRPRFAMLAAGPMGVIAIAVVVLLGSTPAAARPADPVGRAAPTPTQDAAGGHTTTEPAAAAAAPVVHATDARLQHRIRRAMSGSSARDWSVVADVAGVGRVAEIHPGLALRPASTQKLFTSLAMLRDGGPARHLFTTVAATAAPVSGVVHGDLVVRAGADPTLTHVDLANLAAAVHGAGIHRVSGRLIVDVGDYTLRTHRDGWLHGFVPDETGPLSPFAVDEDLWRGDPSYLDHPTLSNGLLFRRLLRAAGVRVVGTCRIDRNVTTSYDVARHVSRHVSDIAGHTLRVSDNFAAETFLTAVGGIPTIDDLVARIGITDRSRTTDGSGLSYKDRKTTRGEVALLHFADRHPALGLRSLLPVACRSGTLKYRMCHTIAAGNVEAKTGTLDHTTALTGWTSDAKARRVTFSIITMGDRSTLSAAAATDKVVLLLRGYGG